MVNRKKRKEDKNEVPVQIRIPASLKDDVDAMAEDTGISTSQRIREFLRREVKRWKES